MGYTLSELIHFYKNIIQPKFKGLANFSLEEENKTLTLMEEFFKNEKDPFSRRCLKGHFTGSSWVINSKQDKVALCFHKKIGRWLQLGGHCDGCDDLAEVSMKEAVEESGIEHLIFWPPLHKKNLPLAFDFDVHTIPQNAKDPEHLHLDVRFIIQAQKDDLTISEESLDLKWFSFDEVRQITQEESVIRQLDKFLHLKKI